MSERAVAHSQKKAREINDDVRIVERYSDERRSSLIITLTDKTLGNNLPELFRELRRKRCGSCHAVSQGGQVIFLGLRVLGEGKGAD